MLQRYGSLSGKLQMIELEKDPAAHGLGISLTGNKDGSRARMGVYVAAIDPLGPAADSDGRLKRGDQIIAVNGHCLEGVTHAEAVDILKKTKGTVVLTGSVPVAAPMLAVYLSEHWISALAVIIILAAV
uniref:PDZ domain-containing protein n=1 Tax=Neolamprologus brichardi TaxID=32507 RepID=A0A3Q4HH34_NEOBR